MQKGLEMGRVDVVIIGAGMGGLITGAILAKENRMKVLVLEKESEIGGRVISFGGPHGNYSAEEYRRLMRGAAGVWIIRTEPKLEKIVESGLFRDHIIDVGWHGVSSADRCRFALTAKALGKELDVSPMVGFLYWRDGKWFQLNEYTKAWPKTSIKERSKIARERLTLSTEEASFYDHVDVKSYLESVTEDQNVRDYYATLAAIQLAVNDITRISAGEWIKTNNMTSATGRHLVYGGGMGEVTGGFKMVAKVFAEIIRESGGEVRTNARVKEVEIKGYRAKGVVVEQSGKTKRIESSVVVSNLPMDKVFEIIPEHYFPKELRERIKNIFPTAGISGNIKLKKLLETEFPKAIYALDRLPGIELRGPANFQFEQVSVIDPSRIINGKGNLMQVFMTLSARDPDEVHNKEIINKLCDLQLDFLRKQYPQFDDLLEWYIFVAAERVYGISPIPGLIGDRRPNVKHPLIKNLFFTGDTVTQWDMGSNGAAHGAIICASAVAEKNYLQILPPYMR